MKNFPFSLFTKVFLISLIFVLFTSSGIAIYFSGHLMAQSQTQKQKEIEIKVENANRFIDSLYTSINNAFNYILLPKNIKTNKLIQNFDQICAYTQTNKDMVFAIHLIRANTSSLKDRFFSTEQSLAQIYFSHNFFSLYNQSIENVGVVTISKPYYSLLQSQQTISFMKPLKNEYGVYSDVLVIECNANYIPESLLSFLSSKNEALLIFNSDMVPIAFNEQNSLIDLDYSSYPPSFTNGFTSLIKNIKKGFSTVSYRKNTIHAYYNSNNVMRWKIIYLVDNKYYSKDAYRLLYLTFFGLLPYIPFMLIFCWFLSGYITKPIKRLAFQMDSIQNNIELAVPPESRRDEIGILSRSFNKMLKRIQKLMESQITIERQKQEIQLKLLQSQIQPHFLGNTLLCINSLAHEKDIYHLDICIKSLIRLLYTSTDKCQPCYSLAEEFKCLHAYIDIQSLRFQREFKLEVSVFDDYLKYPIPKLLLQPIIENSILHGFDESCKNPQIEINGLCTDNNFHIFISDNGIGMTRKQIQNILNGYRPISNGHFSSIGIVNTRQRIKLFYGKDYDLYINSTPNNGTTVEFCLPLKGDSLQCKN